MILITISVYRTLRRFSGEIPKINGQLPLRITARVWTSRTDGDPTRHVTRRILSKHSKLLVEKKVISDVTVNCCGKRMQERSVAQAVCECHRCCRTMCDPVSLKPDTFELRFLLKGQWIQECILQDGGYLVCLESSLLVRLQGQLRNAEMRQ